MQHPAMPIPMTPVGFPEPLSTEADGYRRLLASWIAQAQPRVDYYYDDRGNRVYCRDRIRPMVQPLLRAMGLSAWGYTLWRHSANTPVDPVPPAELFVIPINVVSGRPEMVQRGRRDMVIPGWYTVSIGAFELLPEFDCLFVGGIPRRA